MLKAITHSKAGRVSTEGGKQSQRWKDIYQQREDLMTAAVFSRLAYLSEELLNQILSVWFGVSARDKHFISFEKIIFWPRYRLTRKDETHAYVEPDVLLIFQHCYVLVEVKPPQGGGQYQRQWHNEICAFLQDSANHKPTQNKKKLHFLALGRIDQNNAEIWFKSLKAEFKEQLDLCAALRWQPAADQLSDIGNAGNDHLKTDQRVLADIFEALALYGLHTKVCRWPELLESISSDEITALTLEHALLVETGLLKTDTDRLSANQPSEQDILTISEALSQFIELSPDINLQGISSWTRTK